MHYMDMSVKLTNKYFERGVGPDPATGVRPGQWYWAKCDVDDDDETRWLGCVIHLGSNYVLLRKAGEKYNADYRFHFDTFHDLCVMEHDAESYINSEIEQREHRVKILLGKIQALMSRFGVKPAGELTEGEGETQTQTQTQALAAVSGTDNVKKYKKALIKAHEKTLPALFKQVEKEQEHIAHWMGAKLMPLHAEQEKLEKLTAGIEGQIFTVELYAGLTEELVQLRAGKGAPNGTKVSLFQRRHYMDEECLARYEAGGMSFADITAFDAWLLQDANRDRLLPTERCIVAFRVRRYGKEYSGSPYIRDFIKFWHESENDRRTFLYIRNGEQVWRMSTAIDFGEELFPDIEHSILLNGADTLWADCSLGRVYEIITKVEYDARQERYAQEDAEFEAETAAFEALPEEERKKRRGPWRHTWNRARGEWGEVSPDSLFYDDVMAKIAATARDHNRIAVIVQGLLDRSPALQPHPPWQLWSLDGFDQALTLVLDKSRAITSGEAPSFEEYRQKLNETLQVGCYTIGQEEAWLEAMAEKEAIRRQNSPYLRGEERYYDLKHYRPYGNPGPGKVAEVKKMSKGKCTYSWLRGRIRYSHQHGFGDVEERFRCPVDRLLNASAYKAGDFHMFYDDPRTRAEYLEWAPYLLAAEDFAVNGLSGEEEA